MTDIPPNSEGLPITRGPDLHIVPAIGPKTADVLPLREPRAASRRRLSLRASSDQLAQERTAAHRGHDELATARQHAKGKLTVRERLELLLDEGSFTEIETFRRHQATGFGMERGARTPTAWSPGGARSTAARSSSTRTTSASSAARSARRTPRRSTS